MRTLVFGLVLVCLAPSVNAVPVPKLNERIAKLIADLDSDQFRTRESAHRALLEIGPDAVPALKEAIAKNPSAEVRRRAQQVLTIIYPVFEAHSNGWHWVYENYGQAQTFKSPGTAIQKMRLRVARMNKNQPGGALEVEIRDPELRKIYLRGHIPAADSTLEFKWHSVKLDHVADLKENDAYVLVFHSRDTTSKACWAVNAVYKDAYPHGQHTQHAHEDFLFELQFSNRRTLRVGPEEENTQEKLPINSGNEGGTSFPKGGLSLPGLGAVPDGEAVPVSSMLEIKKDSK